MRFNGDTQKQWNFSIVIGGDEVPTLAPWEVKEKSVLRNRTPEEKRRMRRPGAFVMAWRWLIGEPVSLAEIAETAEYDHTLELCLAFTPKSHHHKVRALCGGDLMLMLSAYMGAQGAFSQQVASQAEKELLGEQQAAAMPTTVSSADDEAARLGLPKGARLCGPLVPVGHGPPPAAVESLRSGRAAR